MKKMLFAAVAAAALTVALPAAAADLGAGYNYNKAPAYAAPIYTWTGFYVGAHLGGAFGGNNNFNGLALSDNNARFLGGVQAGADWQFGYRPVAAPTARLPFGTFHNDAHTFKVGVNCRLTFTSPVVARY